MDIDNVFASSSFKFQGFLHEIAPKFHIEVEGSGSG